ncbi:DUF2510 domain-containing protein [Microbacterium sp. NPDC076911]|uniref:DUF2510 domain-containing protein n=1 Tax=Microbacterium sp. NPDC076911 TaxID=3154958 RepID=UPI00342DD6B3
MSDPNEPSAYAANWYPDANAPGQERYYDGSAWTDQVRPAASTQAPAPAATVAPEPEKGSKKTQSIVGIVALAISVVGFIFACIPGAFILGWVLLPVGFILGIVALFQKGKPKWPGLTAIIVSVIGTIVGMVVFIALAAGAVDDAFQDSVTEDVSAADTAEEEDPAVEEPAAVAVEELVLGESTFGVNAEDGWGWYAVQVTNPNEDYVFSFAEISVEAYDAAGVLLDTSGTYTTILSGESWYVGDFYDIGTGVIDYIEVRVPMATEATYSPASETGTMTITDIVTGSEYDWMTVTGKLVSDFSNDQDFVTIDLIARDSTGNIVGVNSTYTDRVPAGGTVAWESSYWTVPLDSSVTAYPHL